MVDLSWAALRAFAEVAPGSHLPAAAVASSRLTYLIVNLPTFPLAFSSASFSPLTTETDCGRESPCSGRPEETGREVEPVLPPPLLLLLLSLLSLPQAATPNESAASRQPEAAR